MNLDIKKMDIKELKVLAFDTIAQQEITQHKLKTIVDEINKRNTENKVEKKSK